jgi:hypothetical protein
MNTFEKASEECDFAAALLDETRAELYAASCILYPSKNNELVTHPRHPKQGELFLYLPEDNKVLAALCLNSLVETL